MHFTYEPAPRPDLSQGDIIRRTPEVEAVLKEVHPHYFSSASYKFFIILTQSCDLVRRDGQPCKGRYISIAAVRPLTLVVEREIAKHQRNPVEKQLRFCCKDHEPKMLQFMERLLNNNEEEYFYLFRQPPFFDEDYCAFLHLSIALKAELHYPTLLAARVLQLTESFQHKLGYLVGTLYSRVGTEDWLPDQCDPTSFEELKRTPIHNKQTVLWLERGVYKFVMSQLAQKAAPGLQDLEQAVKEAKVQQQTRKRQVVSAITEVLTAAGIEDTERVRLLQRIQNNPEFIVAMRN